MKLNWAPRAFLDGQQVQVMDGTCSTGSRFDAFRIGFGRFDQVFEGFIRGVRGDRNDIRRTAHDEGVPHVEFLVPAALHAGRDVGFGQAAQGVAVMGLAVRVAHAHGTCHTAGFVDDVDVDAEKFGHFSMDDTVACVGSATGAPDHDGGDIS